MLVWIKEIFIMDMNFKELFASCKKDFALRTSKIIKRFDENIDLKIKNKDSIIYAIQCAYGDAKRTFRGIGKNPNKAKAKEKAFNYLVGEFYKYFMYDNGPYDWDKFSNLLQLWREKLIETFKTYSINMTVGQAQKIINVALKILYCYDDAEDYEAKFENCHMPLDSYILDWYREVLKETTNRTTYKIENICFDGNVKWSSLNNHEVYKKIQNHIRSYLSENKSHENLPLDKSCLKSEFVVWPYIIWKEKMQKAVDFLSDKDTKLYKNCLTVNEINGLKEQMKKFINE